jgi:endonuclease/exonuclease/phosphatase family metal-dependent hydrolase
LYVILFYMKMTLKVATWNIGGGHTINSANMFDYDKEDLSYFAGILKPLNLDVICLQESHTKESTVISNRLAEMLGLAYVYDSPRSPSHIDESYKLADAIISRYPIHDKKHILLPYPPFELNFQNGKKAKKFPTYLQTAVIQGVLFANTHLQPLHIFGYSWSEGEGKNLAFDTESIFLESLGTSSLIFAGDFNAPKLQEDFPRLIKNLCLSLALDGQPTDVKGKKTDYILCSPEFTVIRADVIKTKKSDHFLCWAELETHSS